MGVVAGVGFALPLASGIGAAGGSRSMRIANENEARLPAGHISQRGGGWFVPNDRKSYRRGRAVAGGVGSAVGVGLAAATGGGRVAAPHGLTIAMRTAMTTTAMRRPTCRPSGEDGPETLRSSVIAGPGQSPPR